MTIPIQADDDPDLLDLMIRDLKNAPAIFQPTNYWSVYEKRFIPDLEQNGLTNFRRRRDDNNQLTVFDSMGASDLAPMFAYINLHSSRLFWNRLTRCIPLWSSVLQHLANFINKPRNTPIALDLYGCTLEDLKLSAYRFVRLVGQVSAAKPIELFEASLVGNPEDIVEVEGRVYTMRSLYYYLRYAYCSQFIDFNQIKLVVELGPGIGKQVEVVKKLHPEIQVLLFDIAPELYVSHQFLSKVFPNSVVGYRNTRDLRNIDLTTPGQIYVLPNWKIELIEDLPVDLFWNAISFQEMEPAVVANYLQYVNRAAKAVFLSEKMDGKERASRPGEHGVLEPTTLEHYKKSLTNFELVDMSLCVRPLGVYKGHHDTFWRRREGPILPSRESNLAIKF